MELYIGRRLSKSRISEDQIEGENAFASRSDDSSEYFRWWSTCEYGWCKNTIKGKCKVRKINKKKSREERKKKSDVPPN